ncbi:MAG: sialidase, partial [Terriglobia bacterium]
LALSTKGRGFYILDDIGPLQQLTPQVLNSPAYLFKIRPAYRFRRVSESRGVPDDPSAGRNPPYGADINYYLKAAPKGGVMIAVLDSQGQVVRSFKGAKKAGINRVYWDLRYPPVKAIDLRTTPASYPQIWRDSRFIGKKTRPIFHWGIEPPKRGALADPGTYRVKLTVGGQSYTQPLTVLKDPHSAGTLADVEASVKMWRAIDADVNAVVEMINSIERVRKQIEDMPIYVKGRPDASEILASAKQLDGKLQAVEYKLFEKYLAAGDEKTYPEEMQLYQKFIWLAGEVGDGAGDVPGNPDFPPTAEEVAVFGLLKQRLANVEAEYSNLMNKTLPAFNSRLKARGVAIILNPAKLAP